MNAIASSLNKGALKVAPKAGPARKLRRTTSTPKSSAENHKSNALVASEDLPSNDRIPDAQIELSTESPPLVPTVRFASNVTHHEADLSGTDRVNDSDPSRSRVGDDLLDNNSNTIYSTTNSISSRRRSRLDDRRHSDAQDNANKPADLALHFSKGLGSSANDELADEPMSRGRPIESQNNEPTDSGGDPKLDETIAPKSDIVESILYPYDETEQILTVGTEAAHRSTNRRSRRKREITPEAAELQTISATATKMAELCKDLRQGRKSTKYAEFVRITAERRRQKRKVMGRSKTEETVPESVGRDSINPVLEEAHNESDPIYSESTREISTTNPDVYTDMNGTPGASNGAPQVRVVNGEIILDVNSLQIDRAQRDAAASAMTVEYIEENPLERHVNSRSYSRHVSTIKWDDPSTELFYEGLSQWGTDFDMISRMFPTRTRKQIKNKYTLEERKHPELIRKALILKKPVDMQKYSKLTETTFRPLDELEEELLNLRNKFETEREEAMIEIEQRKQELSESVPLSINPDLKRKSRKRKADDGLELVGSIEDVVEGERQAALLAAAGSDDESS